MERTLRHQAQAQEGDPIPVGRFVNVRLIDSHGNETESWKVNADSSASELTQWAGDYVSSMAAEGMSGSVIWELAAPETTSTDN